MKKTMLYLNRINKYADMDLLSLRRNCKLIEISLRTMAKKLPKEEREILKAYFHARDELETQILKASLRWGLHR